VVRKVVKRLKDVDKDCRIRYIIPDRESGRHETASKTAKRSVKSVGLRAVDRLRAKAKSLEWGQSDNERQVGEICTILADILNEELRSTDK
jgi:hypothetical protein